jgi:hypothetical protein
MYLVQTIVKTVCPRVERHPAIASKSENLPWCAAYQHTLMLRASAQLAERIKACLFYVAYRVVTR